MLTFDFTDFQAIVAGFSAFGAVTGVTSATAAFLEWWYGEADADIGAAVNAGLVWGFVPALATGFVAYAAALDQATRSLLP